jgi:hypothetical protein
MSEEQADYITEAMEMAGKGYEHPAVEITPPHAVIERRGKEFQEVITPAFVKISTGFKEEMAGIDEIALKVWLYIALSVNRYSGKANPGLRTIAAGTGFAINTVQSALKRLETDYNLLTVDRESRKYNIYEPLAFVSANKTTPISGVSPDDTVTETVSVEGESVSAKAPSVSPRMILNQINQSIKPDNNNHQKPKFIPIGSPEEMKALHAFTDCLGKFHGEKEVKRWLTIVDAIGIDRAGDIIAWAEKREIHLDNRPGLMDSLETAAKKWLQPRQTKPIKGDNTDFFKKLAEA